MASNATLELIVQMKGDAARQLREVGSAAEDVHRSSGGLLDTLGKFAVPAVAVGALAGAFSSVVGPAAEFGAKMSEIQAVSGATGPELQKLHDLALQLGQATDVGSVSASDAAEAISVLSKAGVTAQQQMDGMTHSVLQLAAAAGPEFGVANSAELASDAMAVFGIKAKDSTKVVNTLVGAANASTIGLSEMKFSLSSVGVAAATVGMNFEDTATAIALFGKNGLKGSDAGTSLKTMLMNLQPSTVKQKKAMMELGLATKEGGNAFFDATGKMKSLENVSAILQDALGGLTEQQKFATLETIFGSDAIRAASILTKEGAKGVRDMSAAMGEQGNAALTAATMSDNLKGKWEAFQGTVETLQISLGEKLAPALSKIVDGANVLVGGAISQLPGLFDAIGRAADTVRPFITPIADAIGRLVSDISAGKPVLDSFGEFFNTLGSYMSVVLPILGDLAGKVLEWVGQQVPKLIEQLALWGAAFIEWVGPRIPPLLQELGKLAAKIFDWTWNTALPALVEQLGRWGAAFVEWVGPKIPPMLEELGKLAAQMVGWIVNTALPTIISRLVLWGNAFVAWVGPKIPPMIGELAKLLARLLNWIAVEALPAIIAKLLEWGRAFVTWIAPTEVQMHVEFGKMLQGILVWMTTEALPQMLVQLDQWGNAFVNWIAKDVLPNLPGMLQAILDQIMGWGNQMDVAVGNKMVEVGRNLVAGLKQGIQNAWDAFIAWLSGLVDSLPQIVKDILGMHSPSVRFAEIGYNIPAGIALGVRKGLPLIDAAFGDMIGKLLPPTLGGGGFGIQPVLAGGSLSGGFGIQPVAAGGWGSIAGGGSGGTAINIVVNTGAGVNGDEIAQKVAAKVSQAMGLRDRKRHAGAQ